MSTNTTNLDLFKYDPVIDKDSTFNITTALNDNWDKIDADSATKIDKSIITTPNDFIIGSGNGTVEKKTLAETKQILGVSTVNILTQTQGASPNYTAEISGFILSAGQRITVKFHSASATTSMININGLGAKGIKKSNGSNLTNIPANSVMTFVYDGSNFIVQGEGASGNAVTSDLLLGKTASTDVGEIVGSIPTVSSDGLGHTTATNATAGAWSGDGKNYAYLGIPTQSYTGSANWVQSEQPNLVPSNLKAGTTMMGITGTFTSDANVLAEDLLLGKTAYSKGTKISGSAVLNTGIFDNPTIFRDDIENVMVVCPDGLCRDFQLNLQVDDFISIEENLTPSNIVVNKNILGVQGTFTSDATATANQMLNGSTAYVNGSKITGTMAIKQAQTYTPSAVNQTITASQYLAGNQTILGDANLTPSTILKGKTLFGVTGTAAICPVSFTGAGNIKAKIITPITGGMGLSTGVYTKLGSFTVSKLSGTVGIEYTLAKSQGWSSGADTYGYFKVLKNGVQVPSSEVMLTSPTYTDNVPAVTYSLNVGMTIAPSDVIDLYTYMTTSWGQLNYFRGSLSLLISDDLI